MGLGLCVDMYTLSWGVLSERDVADICGFYPNNSGTHQQRVSPCQGRSKQHLVPWWGRGGYRLLITESRHAEQANPCNETLGRQIRGKTNASLSHGNMTCLRTLYTRVLSSMPFKSWPTLLPLPPPRLPLYLNLILRMLHHFRGYFLTNAKWLCSRMIKVDIFLF